MHVKCELWIHKDLQLGGKYNPDKNLNWKIEHFWTYKEGSEVETNGPGQKNQQFTCCFMDSINWNNVGNEFRSIVLPCSVDLVW